MIFLFLAFYKPNRVNLEGNWKAKKIIINGKKIYPDSLATYISIDPEIVINNWSKTISIPIDRKDIEVQIQYLEAKKNNYKIRLTSSKKSLNGIFDLKIDTFDIKPTSYTVDVELKSNKTIIYFQKHIIIPPWKPDFPRRGRP